jgi:hypothetical protein
MTILGPNLALIALAIPFVVSFLGAWAWGWLGLVVSVVAGATLTFLTYLYQVITFVNGPRPPLQVALIFITWLMACVPGSIIGLAIRAIAMRRGRASKLSSQIRTPTDSN